MHLEHRATNATSLNGIERAVVTRWHGRKYEDGATAWWRKKLDSASTPSAWSKKKLAGAGWCGQSDVKPRWDSCHLVPRASTFADILLKTSKSSESRWHMRGVKSGTISHSSSSSLFSFGSPT
ncbi:hypothetical protein Q7P37_010665 [Cladosporium fusiforme]